MKAKTVNFERGQDPKKSMNIGMSSIPMKEQVESLLTDIFFEYSNDQMNYAGFGEWLGENAREIFLGATYGDYPIENAQEDFDEFLRAFNSIVNKPL